MIETLILKFKNKLEQKQGNIVFGKINGENLSIKEKGRNAKYPITSALPLEAGLILTSRSILSFLQP